MKKTIGRILTLLITILSLLSVVFLWKNNLILFMVLAILAIILLSVKKSKAEIKTFISCGIFGAVCESIAIFSNAWNYKNPNLINIPAWLIILWGITSVVIIRTYFFFKNREL